MLDGRGGTYIMKCFKCKGYNHKASECRSESVYFKYHGNHNSKEFNKQILLKYVNCVKEYKRLNLGVDENHVTHSRDCSVYQNKVNLKKRRIGLST